MAHFLDLSSYAYGHSFHHDVVHVGWLDKQFSYECGSVDVHLLDKIRALTETPVELYRGYHFCNLCPTPHPPKTVLDLARSNGEIRVTHLGVTYAAPVLIVHYIEEHGYLPPEQFLQAVESIL